jgi:transposase-like protein
MLTALTRPEIFFATEPKTRPLFPNDEAVFKLMYLALRNISKRWTMPIPNWSAALNQFAILFDGRVPMGGFSSNSLTQTA